MKDNDDHRSLPAFFESLPWTNAAEMQFFANAPLSHILAFEDHRRTERLTASRGAMKRPLGALLREKTP